jgi:mannosyltransferase OCH1-like enzyme
VNIEKKMTHIWIGPKPAPTKWMNTWKDMNPDWEYSVFTDEMMKNCNFMNQHLIDRYYNAGCYAGAHDVIRYELINQYGGFWPSADSVCLEPIDELFNSPANHAYTVYENEKAKPGYTSPILAANPDNEVLKIIINTLYNLPAEKLNVSHPYLFTGNHFLSELWKQIPDIENKLTRWPSYTLIPQWYANGSPRYDGPGKVYAEQYWGSTGFKWLKKYSDGV